MVQPMFGRQNEGNRLAEISWSENIREHDGVSNKRGVNPNLRAEMLDWHWTCGTVVHGNEDSARTFPLARAALPDRALLEDSAACVEEE